MKAVLALVLLAALQSQAALPTVPAFDPNQEYHYDYAARVVTGIKEEVNQFSGLGYKAQLIIQHKDGKVYLKFQNPQIGHFNQKFEQQFDGQEFQVTYNPIPDSPLNAHYMSPFRATFENGMVKSFETGADEPIHVVNYKKAVLSLLQLDMESVNRIKPKTNVVRPGDKPSSNIYLTMEDGIGGSCQTVYEHLKAHDLNPDNFYVIKNKLYDRCDNRPEYFYSNRRGYECDGCPQQTPGIEKKDPLRHIARTFYMMKGERKDFTIEKIYNSARYIFNPFTTYGRTIVNGVNQTLFLQKQGAITADLTLPANLATFNTLTYDFTHESNDPEHLDLAHAHSFMRNFLYNHEDYKNKFDSLFKALTIELDYTEDIKKHDITGKFVELIHLLETLTYDQLIDIHNTYLNFDDASATPEQKMAKKIFYDVISSVGTGPAFMYIKFVVENKKVDDQIAEQLISTFPYFVKEANEKLVEEFGNMVKNMPHAPYSSLSSAASMAFGHLINKGLTTKPYYHHDKHDNYVRTEVAKRYAKKFYELFTSAQTKWERLVHMSTLQNIGLEEGFPYIKDIIVDKEHKYTPLERIAAVYALNKLVPKLREQVLEVMIPLFQNVHEDAQLRTSAFNIIMRTNPSYELMYSIAYGLKYDHSKQVQSYVYSTFQSLANITWPCARHLKEHAKSILEFIPDYDYGFAFSKNLVFDFQNEKYNYGGMYHLSYFGANDSMVPRAMNFRFATNVMGQTFDNFEFGYRTEGLTNMKEKIFGPDGLYSFDNTDKSVLNLFRRHPRNVDTVEKELQEIETSIGYKERVNTGKKSFLLYFKALNQMVQMKYYDETVLNQITGTDGKMPFPTVLVKALQAGLPIKYRKLVNMADITYQVPTEVGVPLVFDLKAPLMFALEGKIKANIVPGFFADERDGKKPTNLELETDLESMFDYQLIGKVGIETSTMKGYGFGFTNEGVYKFPIKGHLNYNFHEHKYELKMKPTNKPYEIHSFKTQPFTYIEGEDDIVPLPEEKNLLPIKVIEKPYETERTYLKNYFGYGFKFHTITEDKTLLHKSIYDRVASFFTKYGQYFEKNYYQYSPSLIKRFVSSHLVKRVSTVLAPKMQPYHYTVSWEPNTENPVTEFIEKVDFDKKMVKDAVEGYNVEVGLKYELTGVGAQERKYESDITLLMEPFEKTLKKVAFNYKRSPLPGYDNEQFMVCYNGAAKAPRDWFNLDPQEKLEVDATLNFGKDCTTGAKITMKMTGERSDEQKELDKTPEKYPFYSKCKNWQDKSFYTHWDCFKYIDSFHTMHKKVMDIKYENIPKSAEVMGHKVEDFLKYYFYNNMETHETEGVNNEADHIRIEEVFKVFKPYVDLKIYKPHENIVFKGIYYPRFMPKLQKLNPFYPANKLYKRAYLKEQLYPTCSAGGDYVMTFDQMTYKYPQTNCWMVMAKDTSKDDKFTVLYKSIQHDTYKKALKAFLHHHKIEIMPIGENPQTAPIVVRVDGVKVDLDPKEGYSQFDKTNPKKLEFVIFKYGAKNIYFVYSPSMELAIMYGGKNVVVHVSQYNRGELAGLCGDFNNEVYHEFVGPDQCVYHTPANFAYSYAVREDSCTIPEHQHECDN